MTAEEAYWAGLGPEDLEPDEPKVSASISDSGEVGELKVEFPGTGPTYELDRPVADLFKKEDGKIQ
jgi:hypothetical protein